MLCGACIAPVMAAAPKKRVRAPWGWCRAFGRNGAATWGGAKVEIDLEVTLGLCDQMTVSQRLRPLVFGGPNYAEQQKAIVAAGERMPGQDRRSGPQPRKAERQVSLEAPYPT